MSRPAARERLREAVRVERTAARTAARDGRYEAAFRHLERAHVLGQFDAWPHVAVHVDMLVFAWRQGNWGEVLGQIPRILLAAPGSWTGRAPRGNTGGANVGIFQPMTIPDELARLFEAEV